MRVGINTRFLIKDQLEGIGWYTYEICSRLVKNHPGIEFYFFFDRPYDESFIFADNITPVVIGPPARHPFLWYVWFEKSLKNALEVYEIDVLFSPDGYMCLGSSVPTMITIHDLAYLHYPKQIPFLTRKYYAAYIPKFLYTSHIITAVSNATKADIIKHFQIKEDKIIVAHNGCRDNFKPLTARKIKAIRKQYTDGAPYFVYLGSVHPRKNLPNLIRSYDQFRAENDSLVKLVIIGRKAWSTSEFSKVMRKSPYSQDIIFFEDISDEAFDLVGAALAMVYVSFFEGFGLPILEAMASGVPIICSKTSSMPEVAGDAAILVHPKKVKTISAAMTSIFRDDKLRKDLIKKGLQQSKQFDWDKSAKLIGDTLIKMYQN